MPANFFPCYPFVHPFEEEVSRLLAKHLDDSFQLIHNVIRPNRRPKSLLPKEIDLCILVRTSTALFIEIKNYCNPTIDDISIEGKIPNPVQEMKLYGQKFIGDLEYYDEPNFHTKPILIVRKKEPQKIEDKWIRNCFEPMEFVNWLKKEVHSWRRKGHRLKDSDLKRIRNDYLCVADVEPFTGFTKKDFDLLRKSRKLATQNKDGEFRRTVLKPLHYKFRCMAYEIRSYLNHKEHIVFQHVMSPEQTMPQPIYWVAFILRDVPNFLTDPQVAFHMSTKDWYESDRSYSDHFTTKLAFFGSSEWMRKLLYHFRESPYNFTALVKESLAGMGYRLVSSRDSNDLFVNTPISGPNLKTEFETLAKLVIDDGMLLRGIGFEKPFYCIDHKTLGNKDELMKTVGPHFEVLLDLLRKLLPEYFEEVKKTAYI
jgi:hypothetical protein